MTGPKAVKAKAQFREALEDLKLSQRAFARLLGVSPVTVNRWCSRRGDALEVPEYARTFVAALELMTFEQRVALLNSQGITE